MADTQVRIVEAALERVQKEIKDQSRHAKAGIVA